MFPWFAAKRLVSWSEDSEARLVIVATYTWANGPARFTTKGAEFMPNMIVFCNVGVISCALGCIPSI